MEITITNEYREEYYTPTRYTTHTYRVTRFTTTVKVREVSKKKAPVALRHYNIWSDDTTPEEMQVKEYRLYRNQLYSRPVYFSQPENAYHYKTKEDLPQLLDDGIIWDTSNRSNIQEDAIAKAKEFLLIGGELWAEDTEPKYAVKADGLHIIESEPLEAVYKTNLGFNALEYDFAVQTALRYAPNCYREIILDPKNKIEVLIPEAVQYEPLRTTNANRICKTLSDPINTEDLADLLLNNSWKDAFDIPDFQNKEDLQKWLRSPAMMP